MVRCATSSKCTCSELQDNERVPGVSRRSARLKAEGVLRLRRSDPGLRSAVSFRQRSQRHGNNTIGDTYVSAGVSGGFREFLAVRAQRAGEYTSKHEEAYHTWCKFCGQKWEREERRGILLHARIRLLWFVLVLLVLSSLSATHFVVVIDNNINFNFNRTYYRR